jgi:pSer/pThr/pTyr-binding forkhead associated (FHA) protein
MARIIVLNSDADESGRRTVNLLESGTVVPRFLFGRQEGCDFRIADDSISDIHSILSRDETGRWKLSDESDALTSGTVVNNQRILCKSDWMLEHNDVFSVGTKRFRFEQVEPEPSSDFSGAVKKRRCWKSPRSAMQVITRSARRGKNVN